MTAQKTRRRTTIVRFPCGHLEPWLAVDRRTRLTERAAWVACHRCNVIALMPARSPRPDRNARPNRTARPGRRARPGPGVRPAPGR